MLRLEMFLETGNNYIVLGFYVSKSWSLYQLNLIHLSIKLTPLTVKLRQSD